MSSLGVTSTSDGSSLAHTVHVVAGRFWPIVFTIAAFLAVGGAVLVRYTGLPIPYWLGCAVGFVCILAAAIAGAFALTHHLGWSRSWPRFVTVLGLVTAAEVVGVYTGWPFGTYAYTWLWMPTVTLPGGQFFPVALPLTWFLLASSVVLFLGPGRFAVLLGGLVLALIDVAFEPVLTGPARMWTWANGDPPVQNYLAWLALGSLVCWILKPLVGPERPKFAIGVLVTALLGTLLIGVTHGEPRGLYSIVPLIVIVGIALFQRQPRHNRQHGV